MTPPRGDEMTAVPALFKCPISLELMKDPVTLCTGQTYDRCSIEPWLEAGNTTCPATMMQLESLEVVPNHTLRRLIQEWCYRSWGYVDKTRNQSAAKACADPGQIVSLVQDITLSRHKLGPLKKLRNTLCEDERSQRCVRDAGGVAAITALLASSQESGGDFEEDGFEVCEEALAVLVSLMAVCSHDELAGLVGSGGLVVSSMSTVLCRGSLDSRVNVATILAAIAANTDLHFHGAPKVFQSLGKLLREDLYPKAVKASLRALLALCKCRRNRVVAIEAGVVPALIELLPELQKANAERALGILDLMCAITEGRTAVMDHDLAMAVFVSQFHTISVTATEYIVSILWSLCQGSPQSLAAAQEAGVFAPLLLLLQIECAPKTRQKCGELLKQVKSGWKEVSCDPHFFLRPPFITAM